MFSSVKPGWKLFRVDRMNGLRKLGGTFDEAKPLFNPTGDKDMTQIYYITQFEDIDGDGIPNRLDMDNNNDGIIDILDIVLVVNHIIENANLNQDQLIFWAY